MEQPIVALKVDVDTYVGTREGLHRLLEILESSGIRATFYFSMGPDNSGKAIRRIFTRKGFLQKMLRTGAPSVYGLKTMLYGTLLPAPMIGSSFPDILRKTAALGHETGIHCWDHVKWHDFLPVMPKEAVATELERAFALYEEIMGQRPETTAAPGWTVSEKSLEVQESLGLSYCSDSRGNFPFYPVMNNRRFAPLQIPTTWATMDELLGENGITPENINDHYLDCLKPGLNVHTIHAELEGGVLAPQFADLLQRLKKRNVRFITLGEAAVEYGAEAPTCKLAMGEIQGRAGMVALQGKAADV